jgi:hypothetical protein
MLPGATVPSSLAGLLAVFRPCFTGSSHRTWDVGSGADTPGLGQVS